MKIIVTAREILDAPLVDAWNDFCQKRGISEWAISEGQMDSDEEFALTEADARLYGLLKQEKPLW